MKEEREIAPPGTYFAVVAKSYKSKVDWELEEFKIGKMYTQMTYSLAQNESGEAQMEAGRDN